MSYSYELLLILGSSSSDVKYKKNNVISQRHEEVIQHVCDVSAHGMSPLEDMALVTSIMTYIKYDVIYLASLFLGL